MPRGAVIYPKDAAQILMAADIFPGSAGAGGGRRIRCSDLQSAARGVKAVGLHERREDFATIAGRNVENFFRVRPPNWDLRVADLLESRTEETLDRVVLDMLAPWRCVAALAGAGSGWGVLRLRRDHG